MAHIKTYLRVKPTQEMYDDYDCTIDKLSIRLSDQYRDRRNAGSRPSSGGCANHDFFFTSIFKHDSAQSEVFDSVAKDTVQGFLNGYNGTIFAYGQTGTGKTFTVEGGAQRYEDRGLAPRALSMIYRALEARQEEDISIHISFLEIYQEVGYDLLNPAATRSTTLITPFPKVTVTEGPHGGCLVRNLSSHLAANEDVAQNLLMQGLANRKVAETSMNLHSSRSHAVFTIQLTVKAPGSDTVTKSKLHLVDLAGSERVSKSKIDGVQLTEAKYINLSLHYLETVIIALQQDAAGMRTRTATANVAIYNRTKRSHPYQRSGSRWVNSLRPASAEPFRIKAQSGRFIPYRNSLLTMVLRDSLGGNCQTSMIATISMELQNLNETISTCRFAQRVACITNTLKKNEEIDDKSLIRKLRRRIAELETEISLMRPEQLDDDGGEDEHEGGGDAEQRSFSAADRLTNDDKVDCAKIVQSYLGGRVRDPVQAGVNNAFRFRECLRLLKKMVIENYAGSTDFAQGPVYGEPRTEGKIQNARGTSGSTGNAVPKLKSKIPTSPMPASRLQYLLTNGAKFKRSGHSNTNQQDIPHSAPEAANVRPSPATPPQGTNRRVESIRPSTTPSQPTKHQFNSVGQTDQSGRSSRDSYKSPFERKREKEIKQLSTKVDKTQGNLQQEKRHLEEFNLSINEQQLRLLHSEIGKKIEETKSQLVNQAAYVRALKHNKADLDLYKQEKLVERHLNKRKLKMEKRQKLIESELDRLFEKKNDGDISGTKKGTTNSEDKKIKNGVLAEKSVESVGKNGKVNTRQVLEMLQNQDKKQEKMAVQIEQHRVVSLSRQIELKEAATRLKLQEFRDRLRQQRAEPETTATPKATSCSHLDRLFNMPSSSSSPVVVDMSTVPESSNDAESSCSAAASTAIPASIGSPPSTAQSSATFPTRTPFFIPTMKVVPFNNPQKAVEPQRSPIESHQSGIRSAFDDVSPFSRKPPSRSDVFEMPTQETKKSFMETSSKTTSNDIDSVSTPVNFKNFMKHKSSPADQWNKPYNISHNSNKLFSSSLDTTPVPFTKPKLFNSPIVESSYEDLSNLTINGSLLRDVVQQEQPDEHSTSYDSDDAKIPGTLGNIFEYITNNRSESRESPLMPSNKDSSRNHNLQKDINKGGKNTDIVLSDLEQSDEINVKTIDSVTTKMPEKNSRLEKENKSSNRTSFNMSAIMQSAPSKPMGLPNQTFEEALKRMLGSENAGAIRRVTFSHENYNKFARKGRKGSSKLKSSSTPLDDSTEYTDSRPVSQGATAIPLHPKSISINDSLAKYLDVEPPAMRQPRDLPPSKQLFGDETQNTPDKSPPSFDWRKKVADMRVMPEEEDLNQTSESILIPYETPPETPEMKPAKIVSLKDEEKEEVFMSTAKLQKERVTRIREAQQAASKIQLAFRKYQERKGTK